MLEVNTPYDLEPYVGKLLGTSDWLEIDQARIDAFAQVSGDDNWIHVDVERARRELPGGKTIAHGMLTLSLVTYLGADICRVRERARGINYGSNKVRFTAPVQCGARIRLHRTLERYEPVEGGVRLTFGNRMEIEGVERPAMVAETISLMYAKGH
ncbi:MaoC family dehydratase [Bordetella genomosp. 9]|uniref:Enoyl-CoA hydratase n=1 Tax=Bordetella genomosp. 9 TaxID=1416803 RepID=A0A1W6YVZ9_9BORD|nr:MaoC family dehydratase [Bordetella genomosp. 9]ARP85164.1 enoyl-CoA hydratase [Bordetella genomosp. 9]